MLRNGASKQGWGGVAEHYGNLLPRFAAEAIDAVGGGDGFGDHAWVVMQTGRLRDRRPVGGLQSVLGFQQKVGARARPSELDLIRRLADA